MSKVNSIEELKQKCAEKHMRLEKMRFFIGENRKDPKCFGVYFDEASGNWIVYKNKADGTRAVRYEGPDEARAAQEIWNKIGDEVKLRKDKYGSPYDESAFRTINEADVPQPSFFGSVFGIFRSVFSFVWENIVLEYPFAALFFALVGASLLLEFAFPSPKNGYYQYNDVIYYCLEDQWYMYDSGDWVSTYVDIDDPDDYYLSDYFLPGYDIEAFEHTEYYEEYQEKEREKEKDKERDDAYDNDYDDDDYDYDYDDWDAGDTNWDTDW